MNSEEFKQRLLKASLDPDDFVYQQYRLIEELEQSKIDQSIVRVLLEFMEENPAVDFGAPGPLIPLAERIAGPSLKRDLLESIERRPSPYTVLMLNRIINVTDDVAERQRLISSLHRAAAHPAASESVKIYVKSFLDRLERLDKPAGRKG